MITDNFLGFGTQYNNNLYTTRTFENDGVSEENLPDLEKKVLALGSQYVRIFFDKKIGRVYLDIILNIRLLLFVLWN